MKKDMNRKATVFLSFCMAFVGTLLFHGQIASAAPPETPITINTLDYAEENIVVNNNGNTKIYFATETDAAKDQWEVINSDRNSDGTLADKTTIDISWLSPSLENILIIKGKEIDTQTRIFIHERASKLVISISFSNIDNLKKTDTIASLLNIMTSAGTGEDPITAYDLEWKKGDGGSWNSMNTLTVTQLEKYQIMGTYLNFRIRAVNDDETALRPLPDGKKGRRASNEVKVKIARKSPPMVIGINGGKFTADIKYGKEYRVTIGGVTSGWIQITDITTKTIPLSDIDTDANGTTIAFENMFIEIRDYSTTKSASSKITEIALDAQEDIEGDIVYSKAPTIVDTNDLNIYISYNGMKNLNLAIPSASLEVPYEYCVVKKDDVFNLSRVAWSAITKNTEVKILASKAIDGGTLYLRRKEIKSKEGVAYKLASTYIPIPINYPSIPVVTPKSYTFTKGKPPTITIEAKLNVYGKEAFETDIQNIKLGTREIEFDDPIITTVVGDPLITTDDYFLMTVTLKEDSVKTLPVCSNRALIINFANGTVDKTSVKLTIQNPIPAYTLTVSAKPASVSGSAITIGNSLGAGNSWVYTISDSVVKDVFTVDKVDAATKATAFTASPINISVAANKYLTIYEINSTDNIVKYKSTLITQGMIN